MDKCFVDVWVPVWFNHMRKYSHEKAYILRDLKIEMCLEIPWKFPLECPGNGDANRRKHDDGYSADTQDVWGRLANDVWMWMR